MPPIKKQTHALYSLCFQDDPAFTDAYFKHLYAPQQNVAILRKGEVVSALQLIPTAIRISNHTQGVATSYISGVCTHPSYRGKGLMHTLMERTLRKLYKKGDCFATLIPANERLFNSYASSGFTRCFDYSVEIITIPSSAIQSITSITSVSVSSDFSRWSYDPIEVSPETLTYTWIQKNRELISEYYIDERRNYQGYQYGFTNFWNLLLDDMKLYGGECCQAITPDHLLVGSAICYPQKGYVMIYALTADSPKIRKELIRQVSMHYQTPEIHIITEPEERLNILPLGMARIVNADQLLQQYVMHHPQLETAFTLSDPIIPENNQTYILSGDGRLIHATYPATLVNIEQLTQAVLGYQLKRLPKVLQNFSPGLPYMHLMLN